MSREIELAKNFRDKSVEGFADFYDGTLKAQDNPEFLAAYQNLLSQNDRVLYLDNHFQIEGKEFMASSQHMRMLNELGYEFHLVEYDPSLNPVIESYERGEIPIDDVAQALFDFQTELDKESIHAMVEDGVGTKEEIEASIRKVLAPFVDAIENGHKHGIKVRFFDDTTVIGNDLHERDENSHIDDPIMRRDDTWDPYIEALTKGAKATLFIGGEHAATSYGIDEYMEARGYKVGTFRISSEIAIDEISASNNDMVREFEDLLKIDPDGYDRSDFVVDLFYHDTTKTIEWQKIATQDAKLQDPQNNTEPDTTIESAKDTVFIKPLSNVH